VEKSAAAARRAARPAAVRGRPAERLAGDSVIETVAEGASGGGRCAIVVRNEARRNAADVPDPRRVAAVPGVHPVHQAGDDDAAAIVLARLAGHKRGGSRVHLNRSPKLALSLRTCAEDDLRILAHAIDCQETQSTISPFLYFYIGF
jgi:hypothetical protein